MGWEHVPHVNCQKPLFEAAFKPSGSIWRCDVPGCGKRYRLDRYRNEAGELRSTWTAL